MGTAGNSYTNLLNVENAISLIMVIPGKMAVEARRDFAKIIVRHFAGDRTLEMETEANCNSEIGLAVLAKAWLKTTQQAHGAVDASVEAEAVAAGAWALHSL